MLTREVVWTSRHRAPESSGALDTAGGVVFSGSIDRYFRAYDDQNGKVLWETRLNDVPSNAPISYSVNGKQYIAIGVGNGGAQATTFPPLVPEIQNTDRAARHLGIPVAVNRRGVLFEMKSLLGWRRRRSFFQLAALVS